MSVQNRTELTSQASLAAHRRLGLALLVIATAQLMLVLDDTIVNVALPSVQRALHLATSHLNWVISFYALAFGGLMLAGGRAGDLFGRLRGFRVGVGVFTLASIAGGFAPNGPVLVVARIVQGAGAASGALCALSRLATTFPAGPARTRALGVYGAMGGLGSVVGLLLGGTLTEYASWRWVLFINGPIAVLVLLGTGGTGTGLTFVGCTVTGMREVAPRDSGVAAGLLNTSVQVGSALGLGALAAVASMVTRNRLEGHAAAAALTDGYVAGLLAGALLFAAGAVVAACTIGTGGRSA